jgi:hypothetical protein
VELRALATTAHGILTQHSEVSLDAETEAEMYFKSCLWSQDLNKAAWLPSVNCLPSKGEQTPSWPLLEERQLSELTV